MLESPTMPRPTRPNILFIVLDTQRRDRLSLYGHTRETSPYLDEFARDATLFERAVAPAQWTIPAHGSLFTGLYPNTHELTQAHQTLGEGHITLAEYLQAAGYHTVAFCNNPMLGILDNGLQRGFHHFYNYSGATPNRPVDMRRSHLRRKLAQRLRQTARQITNQFAHNDFLFRASLNPLVVPIWSRLVNYKGHTQRSVDDLLDYWGRHEDGGSSQPIFAFLNLMGTHMPYRPPGTALANMAPDVFNDKHTWRFMARHNADAAAWISPAEPPLADWERRTLEAFYDAEIYDQDRHLGRLLNQLKASGALENTLVIVTADHGEGHGDHDYLGHSFVVYQELVHVPLLIHYPQRFPARRVTTNVSTRRLFHTVLDMAGLHFDGAPGNPAADVQRLSLVNSLNGRPDSEGGIAFSEAFPPDNLLTILNQRQPDVVMRRQLTQTRRGVYHGDHKLALVGDAVENLFDVASDPAELRDVAADQPAVVADLQAHINDFLVKTRELPSQNGGAGPMHGVSPELRDNLRALGYLD